jgi:hypothetical protein
LEGAFGIPKELAFTSDTIIRHCHDFSAEDASVQDKVAVLAEEYIELIDTLSKELHEWRYWQRAWTPSSTTKNSQNLTTSNSQHSAVPAAQRPRVTARLQFLPVK